MKSLVLLSILTITSGAQAQTSFQAHRLDVAGNPNIDATGINKHGDIAASLFDTSGNIQAGVVFRGRKVTTLPMPYQGSAPPMPQAINDRGDVLGYAYEGTQPHLFLWHDGQYDPDADVDLVIEQQQGPAPLPIGLNHRDGVFYTIITGQQNPTDPIYGTFPHVHSMPYLMRYQTAHSLDASGMLAGTTFYESASAVFVGKGKAFTTLLPPGAVTASGGYVNDAGQVAGTYIDSGNVQHGFVWLNGAYTAFDLPEAAQPYSASVTGANNAGRVVGVYRSAVSGMTRAFLYNGQVATAFGNYRGSDLVSVKLNDAGEILVSRQIKQQTGRYGSYRVICSGPGC